MFRDNLRICVYSLCKELKKIPPLAPQSATHSFQHSLSFEKDACVWVSVLSISRSSTATNNSQKKLAKFFAFILRRPHCRHAKKSHIWFTNSFKWISWTYLRIGLNWAAFRNECMRCDLSAVNNNLFSCFLLCITNSEFNINHNVSYLKT